MSVLPAESISEQTQRKDRFTLHQGDVSEAYDHWPRPSTIVSDGAYGLRLFPGDPPTPDGLVEWYGPHVEAWSQAALPSTTLWFWNSEVGWATVHPLLVANGWDYETAHIWDKGVGHIAGNVNGQKIRRFPVVSEVCVLYSRRLMLPTANGELVAREWLRHEWSRSGLPLSLTNEACGVKNAATRKYFTQDHLWYMPPPEMLVRLAAYTTVHGKPTTRPYFSLDGVNPPTEEQWARLRYTWHHTHGITNVWRLPPLHGAERLRTQGSGAAHSNQKPLSLMRQIIAASTEIGDVVWEPFGGLCSASVAAIELERLPFAAENQPGFASLAIERLRDAAAKAEGFGQVALDLA